MLVGIVPAGGLGTRMSMFSGSKEMLKVAGQPVIEYLLHRMTLAKVEKIFIVSHSDKVDLNQYVTKRSQHRDLIELSCPERLGLTSAILDPIDHLKAGDEAIFGLPDTIFYPVTALRDLSQSTQDMCLGLFPSSTPEKLGTVEVNNLGTILCISEKPKHPKTNMIWGCGKLSYSAMRALHALYGDNPIFTSAMAGYAKNFYAKAISFEDGKYLDTGTPESYGQADLFIRVNLG